MIKYTAAYYHRAEDEGWYTCRVLDFPGAISQGRTLDEARRMLCDALRTMAEWHAEDGKPFPKPDPTLSDPEAEVVEPIYLLLRARTALKTPWSAAT
jgi:predicted RNase H-like HicB family nuclease